MRITKDNLAKLQAMLEDLTTSIQIIEDESSNWLSNQDEPKTSEVREDIRVSREALEDEMTNLTEVLHATLKLLGEKTFE